MLRPPRRTIVYVLPWYVRPPFGGAEALAESTARRLAHAGAKVEIWATTAHPGEEGREPNATHFTPGESVEEEIVIRRFPAQRRDVRLFHRLNERFLLGQRLSRQEETAYFKNWIWSESMREEIHRRRHEALYIFAPYFTATTVLGVPAAPHESILQPAIHNEPAAGFRLVRDTFESCRHIFFNGKPDHTVAEELFDLSNKRCLECGAVDFADTAPPLDAALPQEVRRPYIVAMGRQCEGKGTPALIEQFRRFLADSPLPLQLVLVGSGTAPIPPAYRDDIVHLGYVEEPVKWALLANAFCYVLPSENESLSLALLEAWLAGRPGLVNQRSLVPAAHTRLARGGMLYGSHAEFRHALEALAREPELANAMGERGREYVRKNFAWPDIIERQIRFLRDIEQWLDEGQLAGP